MGYMTADIMGGPSTETVYYIAPTPGDYAIQVEWDWWDYSEADFIPASFQLKAIQGNKEYVMPGAFTSLEDFRISYVFTYVDDTMRSAAPGGGFTVPPTQHNLWAKIQADNFGWYQKAMKIKHDKRKMYNASISMQALAHQASQDL